MTTTNKNITKKAESRKYGFISMLSMIVGVVIGSGIFFKNDSMYALTDSAIISMVAWIIISIIVLLMTISFVEVASGTAKKKESATYGLWTSLFINRKIGKIVDYFFVFIYMPTVFILLTFVASEFFIDGIYSSIGQNFYSSETASEAWRKYFNLIWIGLLFIYLLFTMNSISSKGGKILQIGGTGLKIIPLFTIIVVVIVAFFGVFSIDPNDLSILDESKNTGLENASGLNITNLLIIALPSVMYSFDGFTHSAALQNEAKSKSTYKFSLIASMIFIVFIYIFSSWAMFAGGDATNGFSVSSALNNILPASVSVWLVPIITFLIFISVLTGLSGFIIIGNRNLSNLSEENTITDINGKYLKRNKSGVPKRSGLSMMIITTLWLFFLIPMDAGSIYQSLGQIPEGTNIVFGDNVSFYATTEYVADLVTVLAFVVYTMIICGALINRRTQRVKVDKTKFFVVATSISSISMIFIAGYMLVVDIMWDFALSVQDFDIFVVGKFVSFILTVTIIIVLYKYFAKKNKKVTSKQWEQKQIYINAYNNMQTVEEYTQVYSNNQLFLKPKKNKKVKIDNDKYSLKKENLNNLSKEELMSLLNKNNISYNKNLITKPELIRLASLKILTNEDLEKKLQNANLFLKSNLNKKTLIEAASLLSYTIDDLREKLNNKKIKYTLIMNKNSLLTLVLLSKKSNDELLNIIKARNININNKKKYTKNELIHLIFNNYEK